MRNIKIEKAIGKTAGQIEIEVVETIISVEDLPRDDVLGWQ